MGLSDELTTLQDLHEKGKLTDQEFAAAKAATLQKHGSPLAASAAVTSAKPGFKWGFSRLALLLALLFIAWMFHATEFREQGHEPNRRNCHPHPYRGEKRGREFARFILMRQESCTAAG